jgi:hypothetical protein
MIGKLMNKLGYYKINMDDEDFLQAVMEKDLFVIYGDDFDLLMTVLTARDNCKDVFIDYVKKSDTQKVYIDKKLVLEV